MAQAFQYKARKQEDWNKRATQQGGSFIGFIKDEFKTFSHKKGDNAIRPLPPTWVEADGTEPKHYGMDIWVHFNFGPQQATVLCPLKMKNKPCPGCEDYMQADKAGHADADQLKAVRRVLMWLVDRSEEEKDKNYVPQLWPAAWTVDRDITKVCKDKETGQLYQIDHPEAGFDVFFERTGEQQTTKYVGVQLSRRPSPVKKEYLEYIMKHPLTEVLIWRSYQEMVELLTAGAAAEEDPKAAAGTAAPVQQTLPAVTTTAQTTAEPENPYCYKQIKYKGEILACALKPGHTGDCDYAIGVGPVEQPAPVVEVAKGFCDVSITSRGKKLGCALEPNHAGDHDFDRDLAAPANGGAGPSQPAASLTVPAGVQPAVVTQPAAVTAQPAVSSRAAMIRERMNLPAK